MRSFTIGQLILLAIVTAGISHAGDSSVAFGPEIQIYPAGVIGTASGQVVLGQRHLFTFRAGYNATDRRDFGEHDDETGGGPGGGIGYQYFFSPERRGWLLGARFDVWALEIDWIDDPGGLLETRGTTDVIVLQPALEGGYAFRLGRGWRVDATLSLGAEINVDTDGEDVGEGAILLVGSRFVYTF